MKKAILYINQFFGQIGGEDQADFAPAIREEKIGPALEYAKTLHAEITHTIICGDNYMGSHTETAVNEILEMLADKEFDLFLAGPAFQAGRYGVACGTICKAVKDRYHVPVLTSMIEENPGEEVGSAEEEGYFGRGIRRQVWRKDAKPASERMVEMLVKKLNGEPFETELPMPKLDRVPIAPAVKDLKKARIALLNTGGIVPVDNPDRIQSASATRWGRYNISNTDRLESGVYKTIHAGFDPAAADADPNVVAPVDALKVLEKEGAFGSLHPYFYTTVGTGTTQAEAQRMAREILPYLMEDHVDAVIMVST